MSIAATSLTDLQAEQVLRTAIDSVGREFDQLSSALIDSVREQLTELLGTDDCDDVVDELMNCIQCDCSYHL